MKTTRLVFASLFALACAPTLADTLSQEQPDTGAESELQFRSAPAYTPDAQDGPAGEAAGGENVRSEPVAQERAGPDAAEVESCTPSQHEQLSALGREFALRMVREDFIAGRDIEHLVEECRFDGAVYEGILHIRWRGMVMGWNDYNIWGRLRTTPEGLDATFAPRGASESVQSLQFWGSVGTIGLRLVP